MELILFSSKSKLTNLKLLDMSLNMCFIITEPTNSIRDLIIILVSRCISMLENFSSISPFYLHCPHQFEWMLSPSSRQCFISAFIFSLVDYSNAMFAGLPAFTFSACTECRSMVCFRSVGICSHRRHNGDITLAVSCLLDLLQAPSCMYCLQWQQFIFYRRHNY